MRSSRVAVCSAAALVSIVAGEAALAQTPDCDGWVALHEMMPRRNPVMLPTGGDTAFLFGGSLGANSSWSQDTVTATNETWRFADGRWQFVTTSGPSPRAGTAATFDPVRQTVVLFGGSVPNSSGTFASVGDTWEFANGQWAQRAPAQSPSARAGHAMVYDPSRNRTYLYGGTNVYGSVFWSYDGTTWAAVPLSSTNPGPQTNHRLAFDPRDNSIVLFPASANAPVWKWDGVNWSQQGATGMRPISAFFDEGLGTFVLTDMLGAFYTYSGSAAQVVVAPPAGTASQLFTSAIPISSGWLATIAPPINTSPLPYHYIVSVADGWCALPSRVQPLASYDVAFGYHMPTSEFVLFGGSRTSSGSALRETWLLRGETWRPFTGVQPEARVRAFLEYSPERDASILLGGSVFDPTLWSWTGREWSSHPSGHVSGVSGTPPAYDASREAIVVPLGGSIALVDEDIATIVAPGTQTNQGATAFDPVRGLLFASGQTVATLTGNAPNLTWQPVPLTPAPLPAVAPRMVYDPEREGVVLFGGASNTSGDSAVPRRTYFLASDADRWTTLPFAFNGPVGRKYSGMGYDPVAKRIIVYGGINHYTIAPLRETWKLARGPAAVALEPVDTFVIPGQTAELFIIASGGGVIDYQWFKDGQPLANSPRISGADADTLQIQGFTSDDDGAYHVTVRNPCGNDQSVAVQLRVIPVCPGDFDNSGGVDAADIAAFFSAYEQGLVNADVDLSGGIDGTDLAVFFASYESGGC